MIMADNYQTLVNIMIEHGMIVYMGCHRPLVEHEYCNQVMTQQETSGGWLVKIE